MRKGKHPSTRAKCQSYLVWIILSFYLICWQVSGIARCAVGRCSYLRTRILCCPNRQQNFKLLIWKTRAPCTKHTKPPSEISSIHTCAKRLPIHMTPRVDQNFRIRSAFQNHFEICSQDKVPNWWGWIRGTFQLHICFPSCHSQFTVQVFQVLDGS